MTLDQAKKNITYEVDVLNVDDEYLQARLVHFGFSPGARVTIKRFAPIFRDPLLVDIEGTQIMISKEQAKALKIKEVTL